MQLFFDTETTGVPRNYNAPVSDVENWPRLVQLGYVVMDGKDVLFETEFIIKPVGFEIPAEVSKVHGITQEQALAVGVELVDVLQNFAFWVRNCDAIIGHNVSYDVGIVGAEWWRLYQDDLFKDGKTVCTMKSSVDFCKIPKKNYSFYVQYKYPKLAELYKALFNEPLAQTHTALDDIQNTIKCYQALVERGIIT